MHPVGAAQAVTFLKSWLPYRLAHDTLPGLSVAIYLKDQPLLVEAYGVVDARTHTPLRPEHLLNMASQSKMLASIAIWQLAEAGKIDLDEPVATYLPWLKKHPNTFAQQFSTRQLLCHTSGIVREGPDASHWQETTPFPTTQQLQKIILHSHFTFQPGTQLKYSNVGFALISKLLQAITGQSYTRTIQTSLLDQLAAPSFADWHNDAASLAATSHSAARPHAIRYDLPQTSVHSFAPVTGLWANPRTMCMLMHKFLNDQLVTAQSRRQMLRPQSRITAGYDAGAVYGQGFQQIKIGRQKIWGHTGGRLGYQSATFTDPRSGLTMSIAGNGKTTNPLEIIISLFEVFNFFKNQTQPLAAARRALNIRAQNDFSAIEIVATADKIIAIDCREWRPFAWHETLEVVDKNTLRITTAGSLYNHNELVNLHTIDQKIDHIFFGGVPLKVI